MKYIRSGFLLLVVVAFFAVMHIRSGSPVAPAKGRPQVAAQKQAGQGATPVNQPSAAGINAPADQTTSPKEQAVQAGEVPAISMTPSATVHVDDTAYPRRTYKPLLTPNDPSGNQWWVTNTGLNRSWDLPPGTAKQTIAIIDTGFALGHAEFSGRWHTNARETGSTTAEGASLLNCTDRGLPVAAACNLIDDNHDGTLDNEVGATTAQNPSRRNCTAQGKPLTKACNRIDDDNNGYIDDTTGWDFVNGDNQPQAGEVNPNGTGTTHGSLVAGVAAATGNNGTGIAGVDWNASILPIQALDDNSYGDTFSVGRAIHYAIAQGAGVISISLGSDEPDEYVRRAVQEALKAGIVVVAAAGNEGCACIIYPANYPEVIAVGASTSANQPASFSSYGTNLDILAPGTNMISTTWTAANGTSAYASGINGTSFAAPFVAGMVSRLRAVQGAASPTQITALLTENADRLGLSAVTPQDSRFGFGRVNAATSAQRAASPRTAAIPYAFSSVSNGNALNLSSPAEPSTRGYAYICDDAAVPTTPMYELTRGVTRIFTVSEIENQRAIASGYASSRYAYACLSQPHDTSRVMRNINVFNEFRNSYPKQ